MIKGLLIVEFATLDAEISLKQSMVEFLTAGTHLCDLTITYQDALEKMNSTTMIVTS